MQSLMVIFFTILVGFTSPEQLQEEKKRDAGLNAAEVSPPGQPEKDIIAELNKVRRNPKRYAEEHIEELRAAFDGKLYTYPGYGTVRSKEGIRPLNECIRELKSEAPMPALKASAGLAKAASDLVNDQQKHGGTGHIGRDGSTPRKRIEKYGEWNICLAENITYGSFEARQIVIALLIDDGVPDRSHRKNILDPCFRYVGVSFGKHPAYRSMCVMDFAGEYEQK